MKYVKPKIITCLLAGMLLLPALLWAQASPEQRLIVSVERIWDRARHNAFTSLIEFDGKLYCTFRESDGHVSEVNGSVRVIASNDGQNWYSVALLSEKDIDLRDPQLSVTPDGRIMLNMGGSYYERDKLISMKPKVSFSDENGANFSPPQNIVLDDKLSKGKDWLWKATWHKGAAYAGIYQPFGDSTSVVLARSPDGIRYEYVTKFEIPGSANETTLRFDAEDNMIAIVRRDAGGSRHGYIGISAPPYTGWRWNELGSRLGGPDLIILPNGKMLSGSRFYQLGMTDKTVIAKVTTEGKYIKLVTLPSGGDCSYPGMLIRDGMLYMSYYSSHEDKTAIYLARLWLDRLEEMTEHEPVPDPVVAYPKPGIIELSCADEKAVIHFTLDGAEPGPNTPVYKNPVKISHPLEVRARAFKGDDPPSRTVLAIVGTDIMQEAQKLKKKPKKGLQYSYLEGNVQTTSEITKLPLQESGIVPRFSIEPKRRDMDFAFIYEGYIHVPEDGLYTFYLASNDGSKLFLDNFMLINNDGPHALREKKGSVSLKAGYHKIEVKYFQLGGQRELKVYWQGPGFEKREVEGDRLFH